MSVADGARGVVSERPHEELVLRTSFRRQPLWNKLALVSLAIIPSFACYGIVLFLVVTGDLGAFRGAAWMSALGTPLALGTFFLASALIELRPETLTVGGGVVDLRDFWTRTRIPLSNIREIYRTTKDGQLLVTVESASGSVITAANGFEEAGKRALLEMLRTTPPSSQAKQVETGPQDFWRLTRVRRGHLSTEVVMTREGLAVTGVGLALALAAVAGIMFLMAVKGHTLLSVVLVPIAAAFVLMFVGIAARREGLLNGSIIVLGFDLLLWAALTFAVAGLGLDPLVSGNGLRIAPFAMVMGVLVILLGWNEARRETRSLAAPP